jgi:cytochrome P450
MYSQKDFIDSYLKKIEEKKNTPAGDAVYNGTNTTYLPIKLRITLLYNVSSFLPDDQLIQTCTDTFMAGADTTGAALEFAIFYMLSFPEVQKKVQVEIDSTVSRNGSPTITIGDRER